MKVQKIKETLEELGYSVVSACNQIIEIGRDGNGYYLGEIAQRKLFPAHGKVLLAKINEGNELGILTLKAELFLKDIPYKKY